MNFWGKIKKNIKYLLFIAIFSVSFLGGISNAANDLLWQLMKPAYEGQTIITVGENVNTVGDNVIEGSFNKPSIIVKATKILLSLVIALSVTMVLYNGMMYIVQTGQGKDGKDLTKNIAYIVIGILVALFSVVIITLIQSIPNTLEEELISNNNNQLDNNTLGE